MTHGAALLAVQLLAAAATVGAQASVHTTCSSCASAHSWCSVTDTCHAVGSLYNQCHDHQCYSDSSASACDHWGSSCPSPPPPAASGGCSGSVYPSSSSSFTGTYGNSATCRWYLSCSGGSTVELSFSSFQMETNFDYVTVYDGDGTSSPQLSRTSGSSAPSTQVSTGQDMLIRLTADGSVVRSGFTAQYTCQSPPSPSPATTSGSSRDAVPASWIQVPDRYCSSSGDIASYSTAAVARSACESDANCLYISDGACNNVDSWETCSNGGSSSSSGSCMYQQPGGGSSSSPSPGGATPVQGCCSGTSTLSCTITTPGYGFEVSGGNNRGCGGNFCCPSGSGLCIECTTPPTFAVCTFGVGDSVQVKASVSTPSHGWGSVSHGDCGTVASVGSSSVVINFPAHSGWSGVLDEMEPCGGCGDPTSSWLRASQGDSCDVACTASGGSCTDGQWGVVDEASFRTALVDAGEDTSLCSSYSTATNDKCPLIYSGTCYAQGSTSDVSSCSADDSSYARLCRCNSATDSSIDSTSSISGSSGLQSSWSLIADRYCATADRIAEYSTWADARTACESEVLCLAVSESSCCACPATGLLD
eukprot:COSAG02_NODE_5189_length_4555_cov_10.704668_2_plen_590_part_00